MKIGFIAIAGVKLQTRKFIELGITLPQFINRGRVIAQLPSLALLTLAGATPDEIDVEYIEVDDVVAFAEAPALGFDLIALSTYTARAFDAYRVADAYRARGVPVAFGGLHATVLPEEVAHHADAVIVGEGELTWPEVVRDFQRGGRAGLKRIYREARPGRFDLNESPLPRFDLLCRTPPARCDNAADPRTTGELHRLGPYNRITIQTSRGCPWDCDFCAASKLYGPRYRVKPVERVLREVDAVRALWQRPFIEFADDNTFIHKPWSKQLLRELAAREVRYFTETDVSVAEDEELLDLLYPSGCRQVLIGFESPRPGSLRGLDTVNWKARQQHRYLEVIDKIQSRGVSVCGCFIVGLDTDTPAIFDELRDFIERSRLLEVQITVLTPFPGTRLYERLLAEGRLLYPGAWDRCTLFDVNFRPRGMTVEQLEEGVMQLWRDTWNAEAFAFRKRYYRQLLRDRREPTERMPVQAYPHTEADEFFALPTVEQRV
ncbi:MAG TPA: radical SAM protein [Gemmataceae bacterium]|nr:radical SAM protein [Gemmataceae bacterium]